MTTGAFKMSQYYTVPHKFCVKDMSVHDGQRPEIGGNLASQGGEGAHVIAEVQGGRKRPEHPQYQYRITREILNVKEQVETCQAAFDGLC